MSALAEHVESYLQLRRAVGFKLIAEQQLLREFVRFADQVGRARSPPSWRLRGPVSLLPAAATISPNACGRSARSRATCTHWIPRARSRRSSCCRRANTALPRISMATCRSWR